MTTENCYICDKKLEDRDQRIARGLARLGDCGRCDKGFCDDHRFPCGSCDVDFCVDCLAHHEVECK